MSTDPQSVVYGSMIRAAGGTAIISGLENLPNSVLMSGLAVPYFGYPLWAFWLGRRLLAIQQGALPV